MDAEPSSLQLSANIIMDDIQFRRILDHLSYSWAGYRKVRKGVKKRIYRHMQRLDCRNVADYLDILDRREDRRQECELLMTVSISRFFRDRRLWEILENQWLPDIISKYPAKIRVWSAGCACGEEAYSFKIIWEQLRNRIDSIPQLQMMATDRHPGYLEKARKGVYSVSSLREVAPEERAIYFKSAKGTKQMAIKSDLKNNICWRIHHLLTAPPGSDYNVIFLRNNILTYYRQKIQKRSLNQILNCLSPGGFLIIGLHESLPFNTPALISMPPFSFAFKKEG